MNIIISIIAFSFLIIIHELGHFGIAKLFKVKVEEFSLFMGPAIKKFKGKETVFSIRAIPLGGYVSMTGEEEASDDPRAFCNKPAWQRFLIIAAGPLTNIIAAFLVMSVLYMCTGTYTNTVTDIPINSSAYEMGMREGDEICKYNGYNIYQFSDIDIVTLFDKKETVELTYKHNGELHTVQVNPERERYVIQVWLKEQTDNTAKAVIEGVSEGGIAEKAGILPGDIIVSVNGDTSVNTSNFSEFIGQGKGEGVLITVERNGEKLDIEEIKPVVNTINEYRAIGFYNFEYIKPGFFRSLVLSSDFFLSTTRSIFLSLKWLINGTVGVSGMSGPIGVVAVMSTSMDTAETFATKVTTLLLILSLISINLGVANLFPIPALDGSKLILLIVEMITRKKLKPRVEQVISLIGFAILIGLMIFVTFNDIIKVFTGGFNV